MPRPLTIALVVAGMAAAVLLAASPAAAALGEKEPRDPPPQDSVAAVVEETRFALRLVRLLAPAIGLEARALAPAAACEALPVGPGACSAPGLESCARALAGLFDALRAEDGGGDAVRATAAAYSASQMAEMGLRMAVAREAAAAGRCDRLTPPELHPSRIRVGADARMLVVEPVTPLRAGRRYALVVDGLPAEAMRALRESAVPVVAGEAIAVPAGAFAAAVVPRTSGEAERRTTAVAAFARRLEGEVSGLPGLPPAGGLRVTFPAPLAGEQLAAFRAHFVPAGAAPRARVVAVHRVLDAREGLRAYRARLAGVACDGPIALRAVEPPEQGPAWNGVRVFRGDYSALDIGRGEAGSLGAPAGDARPTSLPLLVALPEGAGTEPPLVIALHGHLGRAETWMARHGAALAARGMMVAVPELPGHGERAVPGRAFLDLLDPAGLALGVRQTVVDVLGAVRAVRCGLTLPDGRRLAPRDIRFFGYSLGAMVGAVARTLEPDLGPTVLVAPGGDIAGWLMMQVGAQLGFQLVTCIGGPESGASCAGRKECAPPGTCHADPMLLELAETLHFPYALAAAPGDPLSFAAERAPETSRAPLLLVTGGTDFVLHPLLATRLADAYQLRPAGPHLRRGPRATLVQWPDLGHDLLESAAVREQVYRFLASGGRRVVRSATPPVARGDGG